MSFEVKNTTSTWTMLFTSFKSSAVCAAALALAARGALFTSPTSEVLDKSYDVIVIGGESVFLFQAALAFGRLERRLGTFADGFLCLWTWTCFGAFSRCGGRGDGHSPDGGPGDERTAHRSRREVSRTSRVSLCVYRCAN